MNKSTRSAVVSLFLVFVFSQVGVGQTLSGRVYEGSTGTEPPTAKALAGVTVTLYGSNNESQQGTSVIATATTNSEGWYGLPVSGAYDFFNIVQTNLATYDSAGATSVGGTVKSADWIQYRYEDIFVTPVTTTGNRFWDKQEVTDAPEGKGILDGYKREAGTNLGLENWRIYVDLNANGQWDSAEPSDLTDSTGYYRIADLAPGTYRLCEVMQSGWEPAGGGSVCMEAIDILQGTTTTQDFHNQRTQSPEPPEGTGAIRGMKFNDLNGNGQKDAGEPGLAGWQITLADGDGNVLATATTDASGNFAFNGLDPGAYRIDEVQQSGWRQTYPEVDGQPAFWAIGLEPDSVVDKVDFGNYQDSQGGSASIGDLVWEDMDENGIQDPDEPGIAGVSVVLLDAGGSQIAMATTPSSGFYTFSNLASGDYVVRFGLPVGFIFSHRDQGTDDARDSDVEPTTGQTHQVFLSPGEHDDTVDAGVIRAGDPPNGSGEGSVTIVKRAIPADDTPFLFCADFAPGGFFDVTCQNLQDPSNSQWTLSDPRLLEKVTETVSAGWTLKDITITGDTDQGSVIDISQGIVDVDYDPGENIVITFENEKVASGDLDYGDAPASYGSAWHTVAEGLSIGAAIDTEPVPNTSPGAGGDDAHGTDDEDGMSLSTGLAAGKTVEFCLDLHNNSSIPRTVTVAGWIDFDGDGQWNLSDEHLFTRTVYLPPLSVVKECVQITVPQAAQAGITFARFRLFNDAAQPGVDFAALPTGDGGEGEVEDYQLYVLSGAPGPDDPLDYGDAPSPYPDASHTPGIVWLGQVRPDAEAGTQPIPPGLGDDNHGTSDEEGVTFLNDLVPGQPFAMTVKAYVNGVSGLDCYGWIDFNRDGDWDDAGEFLSGAGSTNYSGYLIHTSIEQVPATASPGKTYARFRVYEGPGSGAPFATGGYGGPGEVEDYEVEIKLDGQVLPPGAIFGGVKFNDLDGDGTQGAGEPGLANWTIWIDLNGNGVKDAGENTLTNPDGSFFFTALVPGTYTVYEEMQSGWTQTYPGGAGMHTVVIQAGQPVPSIVFGNRQGGGPTTPGEVIHGYKWNDLDGDGLWDVAQPIEPALAGWTIWLDMNGNGVRDAGDLTTLTDAIGHFMFPPVPAGTYVLGEVQQPGWTQTTPAGGTHTVTVQGGQGSFPMLFGNRQDDGPTKDGRICGNKWNDLNGDAAPDVGEPGLANWTIYLDMNQNGQLDAGEPSRVTDAAGNFEFAGLAIGAYVLAEQMQPGWQQTWPGGTGTHTIAIQAGIQPACVMFGNQQGGGPGPGPGTTFDWGDAPDPTYPTLRAGNGAYHAIVPGFFLGGGVDEEPDGQPTPDALGDDSAGDDEDGVFFVGPLVPGAPADVEVLASVAGKIDAWIDFDADGGWAQASDQILSAASVVAGSNVLSFSVPTGAKIDADTYARFRFSSQGGLSPEGAAQDGEVEDYHVLLGEAGPGVPGEGPVPHLKWSQPPIEIDPKVEVPPVFCGWGESARSTQQEGSRRNWRMDADDFRCLGPIPITRIRWWGSYKAWSQPELPEGQPEAWHIGFWANQVEGLEPGESYPERLVWSAEVPFERVDLAPAGRGEFPGHSPETCFVYELGLEPEEWFHQGEFESHEDVLWISITAIYPPDASGSNNWGWHTRPHLWGRGAVMPAIMGEWPSPDERLFPGRISPVKRGGLCGEDQGFDMCFELLTEEPWVKWDQPFTGVRDWAWYASEMTFGREQEDGERLELRLVADDWLCERQDPVVAMSWHGSYLGYGYEACQCGQLPEPRPDYFLLAIHTSLPAGGLESYEHPGEKIWEYAAHEYDEVLVGYDTSFAGEPNEAVFRYSVRLPEEEWFRQTEPDTVYWFTVTPVLREPTRDLDRPHQWGWTNHPHVFGDGALLVDYRLRMVPQWQPVRDPVDGPVDMSFTLYTVPEPGVE